MLDSGLMADNEKGQDEGARKESEPGASPKDALQAMIGRAVITILCGVGLYVSLFMLAKSRRAARGELIETSVVQTPRAQLFGFPNALLGVLYYPILAVAVWFVRPPLPALALLSVVGCAAAVSLVLGYSLLFITRRQCPYCWTSHAVNWALFGLCLWIFVPDVLSNGI